MLFMTTMAKVADILAQRGLKQADLARALGVDSARMSRWFGGTGSPDLYACLKIARYLGVPLEFLADPEREGPPPDASWHQDVERFVERVGIDELYMRLYGMRNISGIPKVNAGDVAPVVRPGDRDDKSPRTPRRSGSG